MTEFRLENDDKQDRDDIEHLVKEIADHLQAEKTAEQDENKDQHDALKELPSARLTNDAEDIIEDERDKDDVDRITDQIQRSAEKHVSAV